MNDLCHSRIFAERALLPSGWARDVGLDIDAAGYILSVAAGVSAEGRERVGGPLLPAMPNLHSHAFQRAMAGLAEISGPSEDSFWTWRDTMYRLVGRLDPEDVAAIATRLYVDLMKSGYGAVAEFHYLHHAADGRPYADRAAMSRAILAAAAESGIDLTLLPVFYAHGGFGGRPAEPGQRRFLHGVENFLDLLQRLRPLCGEAGTGLGLAFHSLRAATTEEMRAILAALPGLDLPNPCPIHIHVAEQQREVDDCIAWSGRRPIGWLLDEMPVDEGWCLIHATHADAVEVERMAAARAVVGLCPTTEANLGDGLFPGVAFQAAGGRFGIGSDSHVSTGVAEELRWFEYGQRLHDRRRTRLAGGPGRSVGRTLFDSAMRGGAQALGLPLGTLAPGQKANIVVLDGRRPCIAAAEGDAIIDRWLFAEGDAAVRDVMVAGRWRIRDGAHARDGDIDRAFRAVLDKLA